MRMDGWMLLLYHVSGDGPSIVVVVLVIFFFFGWLYA